LKPNEVSFSSESLIELIKTTLAKNSSFRFRVTGSSMSPFIKDSDIVTISSGRIAMGKAVAFVNPATGKLAIHRMVGGYNGCYLIKGDNIPRPDGLIPKGNVLGCVTKIEREERSVRLGLGAERLVIAFLSRSNSLLLLHSYWNLLPFSVRKVLKEWLSV